MKTFLVTLLALCLFAQCNTPQTDNDGATLTPPPTAKLANPLVGMWKHTNTIFYTSELRLQDNGTFQFHDQGCLGQSFTEGNWTNYAGVVALTSFDSFKPLKAAKDFKGFSDKQLRKKQKLKWHYQLSPDFKKVYNAALSSLNPRDSARVFFDNIQLNLRGDTLYCDDKHSIIGNQRFGKASSKYFR